MSAFKVRYYAGVSFELWWDIAGTGSYVVSFGTNGVNRVFFIDAGGNRTVIKAF